MTALCVLLVALEAALPTVRRPSLGGTLRIAVSEPLDALDPARALTSAEWQVISLVHVGLYRTTRDGRVVPELAAGPAEALDGGRRFRVRLRSARFHDGTTLTGADVVRALSSITTSALAPALAGLTATASGLGRVDVTVPASMSRVELERRLASPALVITRGADGGIGLGPYRVSAFARAGAGGARDGRLSLVRHSAFYRGQPYLDGVDVLAVGSAAEAVRRFHYGEADLVFDDSDRYEGAVRATAPARAVLGLWVRAPKDAAALAKDAPRAELARRLPGATALPSSGGARSDTRWYVGVPEWLLDPIRTALAGPSPWPIEPLDRSAIGSAVLGGSPLPPVVTSLDALFVMWSAPVPADAIATRARARWVPILELARQAVFRPKLHGLYFLPSGTLDLTGAFIQ